MSALNCVQGAWGLVVAAAMTLASAGLAGDETTSAERVGAAGGPPSDEVTIPLPPLPPLPGLELPAPDPEVAAEVRSRFDELMATDVSGPLDDPDLAFFTTDLDAAVVPVIAAELESLKERLDGRAASRFLEDARRRGRKALRAAEKDGREPGAGDWLTFVLASDTASGAATRADVTRLYGALRMLEHVASVSALRVMIDAYGRFGELVRIDIQRALDRLDHRAVAALLEAKQHDASKVRRWATKQLDRMGKVTAGEAVSTTDPVIIADVLRAFGRIGDLDATRVILSYCNADRTLTREAARQALSALGEPAEWHIKDVYKNLTGEKPPRAWDWRRAARELFRTYDAQRLSAVYRLLAEGDAAWRERAPARATAAYDKVLARMPSLSSRHEMVPAYVAHAQALAVERKDEDAMMRLRKARRLLEDGDEASARAVEAELVFLEARALYDAGVPDRILLERALELSPEREEARQMLEALEAKSQAEVKTARHYGVSVGVGLGALALAFLFLRGGASSRPRPPRARASS